MAIDTRVKLPPNPYIFEPQRGMARLPGRKTELAEIEYYLELTASGQSAHIALTGDRGVGKTSVLNTAEIIARDHGLLPIRLDLNEDYTRSPGMFWYQFYSALLECLTSAGAWQGTNSPICTALFEMLCGVVPKTSDMADLRFPYVIARHHSNLDGLVCPDAWIVGDLGRSVLEISRLSPPKNGLVVLIDEADCLKANLPLLQDLRNVFQRLPHCALILAGTNDVFPAISEVFSPVPRQFHRVMVAPFANWGDTADLVMDVLISAEHQRVSPRLSTVLDLHHLCMGDPNELQLYCHIMYKLVEEGVCDRMSLHPTVFKRVCAAYRSHTEDDLAPVLTAIEKLPDRLLYEAPWLRWRTLSRLEIIDVTLFEGELRSGETVEATTAEQTACDITAGFTELAEMGITVDGESLRLKGAQLTAGFWKSQVEVAKGKRVFWFDGKLSDAFYFTLMDWLCSCESCDPVAFEQAPPPETNDLERLRRGETPIEPETTYVYQLMRRTSRLRESGCTNGCDVVVEFSHHGQKSYASFAGCVGVPEDESVKTIQERLHGVAEVLLARGLRADVVCSSTWVAPTNMEVHRLARLADASVPAEEFGKDPFLEGVEAFKCGDTDEACAAFERILADRNDPEDDNDLEVRNALCYCRILQGESVLARTSYEEVAEDRLPPVQRHNYGISLVLTGERERGVAQLKKAIDQVAGEIARSSEDQSEEDETVCMAVLALDCGSVTSVEVLPCRAAALMNLNRLGEIDAEELQCSLLAMYPGDKWEWLREVCV